MPNALAVIAIAEKGGLLNAPDMYMDKIAIGPGYPEGIIDLDAPPPTSSTAWPRPRASRSRDITACILDRPRHAELIRRCARPAPAMRLIPDGDIAGVIWATDPEETGIDIYLGSAARRKACSPPRRCAASAARCRAGLLPSGTPRKSGRS